MIMAEIKLIALDLDGTLLDSRKRLSYKNEKALERCISEGIHIVPCTGRIWGGVPEFIRNFPGIRYAITTNGAVVEDILEQKVLSEQKLSCETALKILELARTFDTMYDAYVDGVGLGEARFINHMERFGLPAELQKLVRSTRKVVPDTIAEVQRLNRPVEKINYFFGDPQERLRARAALLERDDVVVSSSFTYNLEINAPGATKGVALLRLAEHLGLAPEQTMGFGDGENDISMMRMAGVGVAMGNGMESVKAEADYITVTNDEDGVAAAMEKLLWNREG